MHKINPKNSEMSSENNDERTRYLENTLKKIKLLESSTPNYPISTISSRLPQNNSFLEDSDNDKSNSIDFLQNKEDVILINDINLILDEETNCDGIKLIRLTDYSYRNSEINNIRAENLSTEKSDLFCIRNEGYENYRSLTHEVELIKSYENCRNDNFDSSNNENVTDSDFSTEYMEEFSSNRTHYPSEEEDIVVLDNDNTLSVRYVGDSSPQSDHAVFAQRYRELLYFLQRNEMRMLEMENHGNNNDVISGLSTSEIKQLKSCRFTKRSIINYIDCSICMNLYTSKSMVYELGCKHIFHKSCLITWVIKDRRCPLCRCKI